MTKRLTTAVVAAALAAGMSLPATGLASGGPQHTNGKHYGYQHGATGLARGKSKTDSGKAKGKGKACPTPKKPKKDKGKSNGATKGHGKKCGIVS